MIDHRQIEEACRRIREYVGPTRLEKSIGLSEGKTEVFMKMENEQPMVKAFKIRGVLAKLTGMDRRWLAKNDIAAISAGNQGVALAYCADLLGLRPPIVYAPTTVSKEKIRRIERFGGRMMLVGSCFDEAHVFGEKDIKENGYALIDAREDIEGAAGQGSAAVELLQQLPDMDCVIVPKGSGALATSIGSYLKSTAPHIAVYAVEPEYSPALSANLREKKWTLTYPVHDNEDPLLKSLIGGCAHLSFINADALDEILLVNDDDVAAAWNDLIRQEKIIVEPDSAAAYAAFKRYHHLFSGKKTALVLTGANIDDEMFLRLMAKGR